MTYGNSTFRSDLADELDREIAERRKEKFRRLSDEKKYIVKKKRRGLWEKIRSCILSFRSHLD